MQRKMNFRTSLIFLLLAAGIIPLLLMGGVALWRASDALSQGAFSHLESMRELKKVYLTEYFDLLKSQLRVLRDDPHTAKALAEFNRHANESGGKVMTPQWEEAAAGFDPHFKKVLHNNEWYDILLIDQEGRIIYTVLREADLGVVIGASDLKDSSLGSAFIQVRNRDIALSDFAPYGPSHGIPAGFAMAQVKDVSGRTIGYVAFQIPYKKITDIMQVRAGMGKTGETYLVGSDRLMRSDSFLDPTSRSMAASFANPETGKVDTRATQEALAGITSTKVISDYRNESVLSAYTPFVMGTATWALIAEIDTAEAFAPIVTLKYMLGIVVLLVLVAIFPAAFLIVKPLTRATVELKGAAEELRVACQQQTTSTTEQVTATKEISTTMEELLRTAHQIAATTVSAASGAESAHQGSREGKLSLEKAIDGTVEMGNKMENITQNILALGEKAQQMSLVLDIINELADQTTILSFNASIEAAGAGEAGTRFAAVAEQIMNLANKAVDSTKEIRFLIENIQKSTNKTVLITEEGMKAVEENKKRIRDTSSHFETILKVSEENMVTAKEVEMAITQQTNAIDQTTEAIRNVQVTADDVKNSTRQTLETAQMLLHMADGLAQI